MAVPGTARTFPSNRAFSLRGYNRSDRATPCLLLERGRRRHVDCHVRVVVEAAAREDIVIAAARLPDADAVARVACRTAGLSWSCTSRVICDGIAIAWTS